MTTAEKSQNTIRSISSADTASLREIAITPKLTTSTPPTLQPEAIVVNIQHC